MEPRRVQWVAWSRRLVTALIEDAFGQVVADVAATLAQRGEMPLEALLSATNAAIAAGNASVAAHTARGVREPAPEARLTRRQVCDCLLILIQHGLASYELREREGAVGAMSSTKASKLGAMPTVQRAEAKTGGRTHFYALEPDAVLRRLAFPRMAAHAHWRYGGGVDGELAAALLTALHQRGCVPLDEALDAAVSISLEASDAACGAANGAPSAQAQAERVQLRAQIADAWAALVRDRYIAMVPAYGGAGISGRSTAAGTRAPAALAAVAASRAAGWDGAAPARGRGGRHAPAARGRGVAQATPSSMPSNKLGPGVAAAAIAAASAGTDTRAAASAVARESERAGRPVTKRSRAAVVHDDDDDDDIPAVVGVRADGARAPATKQADGGASQRAQQLWRVDSCQFLREWRHALVAKLAHEKCGAGAGAAVAAWLGLLATEPGGVRESHSQPMMPKTVAERMRDDPLRGGHGLACSGLMLPLPARQPYGNAAGSIGGGLHPGDHADPTLSPADALELVSDTDRLVGALSGLAHEPKLRLLVVAHQPALSDRAHFGSFQPARVHLEYAMEHVRARTVEELVALQLSKEAARLLRILWRGDKADEKVLATHALLPVKGCRALLYRLLAAGYVQLIEVPKSAERTPQRTIYLWGCDMHKATAAAHGALLGMLLRIQQRLSAERARAPPAHAPSAIAPIGVAASGHAITPQQRRNRQVQALERALAEVYTTLLVFSEF